MRSMAAARLWLEVNSFSPVPTTLADYEATEWVRGREALDRFEGTPTELGALAAFARRRPDWEVQVSRCGGAAPGGPMDDPLFDAFLAEVARDFSGRRWDAVYLSLHGALATGSRPNADHDVIEFVRGLVGHDTPIGVSFDMHANLGPDIVRLADVAAGYKTLPHLDMQDTAEKVLEMLTATVEGRIRPKGALARPGCILHSFNMRTTDGPMKELEEIARERTTGAILDVTPFGGFPYADSPHTGASVMVYADGDEAAATRVAREVAEQMRARAPQFAVRRPGAAEGLRQALAAPPGMAVVLESGDNTYSGGIADTPDLFRAMVEERLDVPAVFAFFLDPALVARARAAGIGATLDCAFGGRVSRDFGPPVHVCAEVARLPNGVFVNKGPMQRGVEVRMGASAVLRVGAIEVIVTEQRQPVNDPAYFELHGIDLARVRLLCVKAKNHFRAAFAPLASFLVEVDTPGPAAIDLTKMPYRYAETRDIV